MDSLNTANTISRMVVDLLAKHCVKKIVLSPGSRNTPLIIAANRSRDIECFSVVDERSAAFIALGLGSISCVTGSPYMHIRNSRAQLCTSCC